MGFNKWEQFYYAYLAYIYICAIKAAVRIILENTYIWSVKLLEYY